MADTTPTPIQPHAATTLPPRDELGSKTTDVQAMRKFLNAAPETRDERNFKIRPAHSADIYETALIASRANYDSQLTRMLNAHREEYPIDYVNSFYRRRLNEYLMPNNRAFVAVAVDAEGQEVGGEGKGRPVGYVMCCRLGSDENAKKVAAEKESWALWGRRMANKVWCKLPYFTTDRSSVPVGVEMFAQAEKDNVRVWSAHSAEKWYVQSTAVSQEWQRKGLGKALIGTVLKLAEAEGKVVGLESTAMGQYLYDSLGFRLLSRFAETFGDEEYENRGGVMMWTPPGWALADEEVTEAVVESDVVAAK